MHFPFSTLAIAGLLASANALTSSDIRADLPLSSLLNSAQTHLSKGETTEALLYYDAAIAKDPKNYLTFFKRATTYLSLGRTNQATDDFNRVLALKPKFEGAHLQLARLKAKGGDWEGAKAQYLSTSRGHDSEELQGLEEARLAANMAHVAERGGKWDECVEHSGFAILTASRASSLRELRARCRFERGEVEEGLSDLRHVLQLKPGDTTPHILISATNFYGLGDMDNGLAQIRRCLHSDPDSKVCKKLHRQEKAIQKAYNKVVGQLNRGQSTTAGRSLMGTADESGLVADIRRQVDDLRKDGYIPSQARAKLLEQVVEMTCQAYTESNNKDAGKVCKESLDLDGDAFWGLLHRGKTFLKEEDYEQAIHFFKRAAEQRPDKQDKVNPLMNKAQVALKRSKTKDYYKVLGVASDADERQIKAAYRKATKQFHPDKAVKQGITKEEAEKKMAAINEAYEVLSDPELRARFDRGDDPNSQERGSPFQGNPFGGGQPFMFHQQGGFPGGGQNFKFQFGF